MTEKNKEIPAYAFELLMASKSVLTENTPLRVHELRKAVVDFEEKMPIENGEVSVSEK